MFSDNYQLESVPQNAVANSEVSNPFGGSLVNSSSVGTAQVVSRELAEMQAQIYLAKQFQREYVSARGEYEAIEKFIRNK